jgi:two-component system chemotaxis response regulator CheY
MKKSVLIVDDSPTAVTFLKDIIDNLGYETASAQNGQEALVHLGTNKFNMIITDLEMPVMDGVRFVKNAKRLSNCRFVPIVMVSSENNESRIVEARKAGASTFLKKPINEGQLIAMIKIMLGPAS